MPRLTEDAALKLTLVAALLGLLDSLYLSYLHYLVGSGGACPTAGLPGLDCGEVLASDYSYLLGVPVAWLGVAGFAGILVLALDRFLAMDLPRTRYHPRLLAAMVAVGIALGLWLSYAELFLIHELCPFCVVAFGLLLFIAGVLWAAYRPWPRAPPAE